MKPTNDPDAVPGVGVFQLGLQYLDAELPGIIRREKPLRLVLLYPPTSTESVTDTRGKD